MEDVPRDEFRHRIEKAERPDYIPINFFLFNKPMNGIDYVVADELVFQALNSEHSPRFDKLALFAFNFSFVGRWAGSSPAQRRPALWANAYIRSRVARQFAWDTRKINADDIQQFVSNDQRYTGKTSRKLATNLNYLYQIGNLSDFGTKRIERWWVDALFLALDRLIEDRKLDGKHTAESQYATLLSQFDFLPLSGGRTLEKELAVKHLVDLYAACGSRDRFSEEHVKERTLLLVSYIENFVDNDPRPRGAVHPTNPRIFKSIPRACAMLARYAGFEVIGPDELEHFDLEEFIRTRTQSALEQLRERNIRPTMTADELMRVTRGK